MLAALFLAWLAISGVLLNHSNTLNLGSTELPGILADAIYPRVTQPLYHLATDHGLLEQRGQSLILKDRLLGTCSGVLISAVDKDDEFWVACSEQILVFNTRLELIEALDSYQGTPIPVQQFGICEQSLCVSSRDLIYSLREDGWHLFTGRAYWSPGATGFGQKVTDQEIHNWERFILETHSGRLFGALGVLVVDLTALISLLLIASGIYVWWSHKRRQIKAQHRASES